MFVLPSDAFTSTPGGVKGPAKLHLKSKLSIPVLGCKQRAKNAAVRMVYFVDVKLLHWSLGGIIKTEVGRRHESLSPMFVMSLDGLCAFAFPPHNWSKMVCVRPSGRREAEPDK